MVVAYLRGILKPKRKYGYVASAIDTVILEAMSTNLSADSIRLSIETACATIPVLTEDGVKSTIRRASNYTTRLSQLREFDLYRVEQQLQHDVIREERSGNVSLLKLYRLAEESGTLERLVEETERSLEGATPLL